MIICSEVALLKLATHAILLLKGINIPQLKNIKKLNLQALKTDSQTKVPV